MRRLGTEYESLMRAAHRPPKMAFVDHVTVAAWSHGGPRLGSFRSISSARTSVVTHGPGLAKTTGQDPVSTVLHLVSS